MVNLDVSRLLTPGKYAVHCCNEEDAIAFLDFLRDKYPEVMCSWSDGEYHWDYYETDTAYSPELNMKNGRLTYCEIAHFLRRKYTIIRFEELIANYEMPDLTADDFSALICG